MLPQANSGETGLLSGEEGAIRGRTATRDARLEKTRAHKPKLDGDSEFQAVPGPWAPGWVDLMEGTDSGVRVLLVV